MNISHQYYENNENYKNASQKHDPCIICNAEKCTIFRRLRCGHLYCFKCIKLWINENPSCPLCREDQYRLNWPSVCIACGDSKCLNDHFDLDHSIYIEFVENLSEAIDDDSHIATHE